MKAGSWNVGIETKQGKLRIRLPRAIAKDASRYISTRLDDTPANLEKVRARVQEIEEDINLGKFDATLAKYQFSSTPALTVVTALPTPEIKELWAKYCIFIKPQLAVTTYEREYVQMYTRFINGLPTQRIGDAAAIRDHLLATRSVRTAKRTLSRLAACCDWAKRSGLIKLQQNPFYELCKEIKIPKQVDDLGIDPFSRRERDAIIKAFQDHPTYCHYAPFVRFLFLTGCRTGEAIGLQWQHINLECTQITFCETYNGYLKLQKETKTYKTRKFPCNKAVRGLLHSIRPPKFKPDDYIFTNTSGKPIDNHKFTSRIWKGGKYGNKVYKGIITDLVEKGLVERYRCLYNTRHTFVTMALEAGLTVPQVAKLVGNTPEAIMRYYAGNLLHMDVPIT